MDVETEIIGTNAKKGKLRVSQHTGKSYSPNKKIQLPSAHTEYFELTLCLSALHSLLVFKGQAASTRVLSERLQHGERGAALRMPDKVSSKVM